MNTPKQELERVKNRPAPRTWSSNRGSMYWTKKTRYGVRYKCKSCEKETLGQDHGYMLVSTCPFHAGDQP
jgi:hypothetical protein